VTDDVEQPADEQRPEGEAPAEEPAAAEQSSAPEAAGEEAPPAEEQPSEPVAEEEPAAPEAPAHAEEPVAEEPVAAVAETPAEAPAAAVAETPAEAPAAAAAETPAAKGADDEELEERPRVKPEIPGADLVPDIVPEGGDALVREQQDEDGEEPVAVVAGDDEAEPETQPIADAAIDLASGARYRATGKRKTAVARVILKPGTGAYLVNGKTLDAFFPRPTLQRVIRQPLETVGYEERMDVVAKLHGGGVSAQSGALRHGIARALLEADPNLRGELKRRGFLTRDARAKERKKAGLKKARKRPQFSKR
jgi:small subunit ribosomal protein S9